MRRFLLAGLVLWPAFFAGPAIAEDLVTGEMPSEVRIAALEPGVFRVENLTRRFQTNLLASVADRTVLLHQLLEIEQKTVQVEGPAVETAFEEAGVTVRAYPLSDQGRGALAFEIALLGDVVTADGPYLTITRLGCCVEQPTHAVFSLETGANLFNATGGGNAGDWVTLGARGGFENERIIAVHLAPTAADSAVFAAQEGTVAVISYARRDRPLQRLALTAPQAALDADAPLDWSAQPGLREAGKDVLSDRVFIPREGAAESLFTDVSYRLILDDATAIEIPLVADRLDIAAAQLPAGYSLVEMDPVARPY